MTSLEMANYLKLKSISFPDEFGAKLLFKTLCQWSTNQTGSITNIRVICKDEFGYDAFKGLFKGGKIKKEEKKTSEG